MNDVIERERNWLEPLKRISRYYLDTTDLTINLLRKKIKALFHNSQTFHVTAFLKIYLIQLAAMDYLQILQMQES